MPGWCLPCQHLPRPTLAPRISKPALSLYMNLCLHTKPFLCTSIPAWIPNPDSPPNPACKLNSPHAHQSLPEPPVLSTKLHAHQTLPARRCLPAHQTLSTHPTCTPNPSCTANTPSAAHARADTSHSHSPSCLHPTDPRHHPKHPRPTLASHGPSEPGSAPGGFSQRRGSPRHTPAPVTGSLARRGRRAPTGEPPGQRSCPGRQLSPPGSRFAGMFLPSTSLPPSLHIQPLSAGERGEPTDFNELPGGIAPHPPSSLLFPRPGTDALKHNPRWQAWKKTTGHISPRLFPSLLASPSFFLLSCRCQRPSRALVLSLAAAAADFRCKPLCLEGPERGILGRGD